MVAELVENGLEQLRDLLWCMRGGAGVCCAGFVVQIAERGARLSFWDAGANCPSAK